MLPEETDKNLQRVFEAGYEIEEYAYKLYPGGLNAGGDDIREAIAKSSKLINDKTPVIFQATVSGKNLFCRADIIKYNTVLKAWDIIEVKSATEPKETYFDDLAFQKICFEEAGHKVGNIYLIHINNQYVKNGAINPHELLTEVDVSAEVEARMDDTVLGIKDALEVLRIEDEPDIRVLRQCENPFVCAFIPYCWKDFPEHSIYSIASKLGSKKLEMLLDEGVLEVKDIPPELLTNEKLLKHQHAVTHNLVHIEKENIKEELSVLKYPLYFLDYETYGPAIPIIDGYRPYQRVVFQYSLHVLDSPMAELKHYYFLANSSDDPTRALSLSLQNLIGKEGSVIAWNMSFEQGCNTEMGERAEEHKEFYRDVNERMFDLMQVFRKGYYVHKDFHGSASLKKVLLPVVPELSYKQLGIQEGMNASNSWGDMIRPETPETEKKKIYQDLLDYCELDTLAMVKILDKLNEL